MSVFGDYLADDSNLVRIAQKQHSFIDLLSIDLEAASKSLDSAQLGLLIPYLDSIHVLLNRALIFCDEAKKVKE